MRIVRAAIAATAALALAGCGGGTEGTATPATQSQTMDDLLDPCTDVPDEWLVETGLDPSTERNIVNPSEISSWRVCGWNADGGPYRTDLMSSSKTLEQTRANKTIVILGDTSVGGRPALINRNASDTAGENCYVNFSAAQGMFSVVVRWLGDTPPQDLCALAVEHATDLERHLPK
ncbi:DUF3558 domain-containing protein [Nocardia higoensis]|uniref:DUF3558 domain-containing protein n=1 Tax=Nocardia higoensis TaxID=228599 RepID=UPI0002DCEDA4|nr:DUF3558 domain-containing protein [Nocardia higoensis]